MKGLRLILIAILAMLPLSLKAQELDMNEYLFGHVGDSYEWHITTINEKPICIYLPVILYSTETGFHCFSSKHIEEGEEYQGFHIAEEGEAHEGKIVETLSDGSVVKPWDISITKNVFGLFINCCVLLFVILFTARWYGKHDAREESPSGFAGIMEMLITMVEDDIIKPSVGKDYKKYSPYLLTAFFFIFINNVMGIVPFFPGGANITGNIAVTFVLAMCTFLAVNLFGNKHYYKEIFWPDVPIFLKAIPIMPIIEIVGMFTKPFSLMMRLFANILAGHMMILGVISMVFITASMGAFLNGPLTAAAFFIGIFMDVLECLVAFLQAYVFTMLSSVFIGLSRVDPHEE